jgi:hypothetical protein
VASEPLPSPYKFLDSYGLEDDEIFFGRDRETRILLSDIVVARLVVLFAKTGTGKTSLINAGVRPLLEERGYATFVVRVGDDPVESTRAELERHVALGALPDDSLASLLTKLATRLGQSVVVFFDQFEEFFLQTSRNDPDGAQKFIASVADLYEDEHARVHVVFSMREEFFVEMDAFRNDIPTIFHNDSNLRLRWFDLAQAREAITKPAAARGVEIDADLVDHLIADLSHDGEADLSHDGKVEPAQLQIVCDTLWRSWVSGRAGRNGSRRRIDEEDYLALAPDSEPDVAQYVWSRRLQQTFELIQTREELDLLQRLLPLLRTERNTKQPRDIESLVDVLGVGSTDLYGLLHWLEEAHLIRTNRLANTFLVELSHDYLAERLDAIRNAIAAIWPRRILRKGLIRGKLDRAEVDLILQLELALDASEAELVLRSALTTNGDAVRALDLARATKADLSTIVVDVVEGSNTPAAVAAVRALGTPGRNEWLDVLGSALHRGSSDVALAAADALADVGTPEAVAVLVDVIESANTTAAIAAVRALGTSGRNEWLDVLDNALRRGSSEVALAAADALADVGTRDAVALLSAALDDPTSFEHASVALERIVRNHADDPVGAAANESLREHSRAIEDRSVVRPSRDPKPRRDAPRVGSAPVGDRHYSLVAELLAQGEAIPFLGAGTNLCDRPDKSPWEVGRFLPSGQELAHMLAERSRYPDDFDYNLLLVAQYVAAILGEGQLYRYLHAVYDADYPPTSVHRLLARLPGLLRERSRPQLVVLTTNYDDLVERALAEAGEPFDVVWYEAKRGPVEGYFLHRPPDGDVVTIDRPNQYTGLALAERPVILKLLGSIDRTEPRRDSYVVTEDSHIDYLAGRDVGAQIPFALLERMANSHFLFLGYSMRDWNLRMIPNRIWGSQQLDLKSWAVHREPAMPWEREIEEALWRDRGDVDLLYAELRDYVERLASELETETGG